MSKSNYKNEYATKLISWFRDAPLFVETSKEIYNKKSERIEYVADKVAAPCPSVVRFADSIGASMQQIAEWREKKADFRLAYEQAMSFREEWLMNAAGLGFYNSSMSIMALKANHGWAEKSEKPPFDEELKQVLVQFVKSKGENIEKNNGENSGDICSADHSSLSD